LQQCVTILAQVSVIGYCNLEFICYPMLLMLVIWDFSLLTLYQEVCYQTLF